MKKSKSILRVNADGGPIDDGPIVDPAIIEDLFDEVTKMTEELVLDDDPLLYGPKFLRQKIARVRNLQTDVQNRYLRVSKADHQVARILHTLNAELQFEQSVLLANDPEVSSAPNVKDREAICNLKLRDKIEERTRWESAALETQAALTVIKSQQRDLKDLMSRLRDQKKLCEDEIAMGRSWGSKPPPGVSVPGVVPGGVPVDVSDIDDILGEVERSVEDFVTEVEEVTPTKSEEKPNVEEPPKRTLDEIQLSDATHTPQEVSSILDALDLDAIPEGDTPEIPSAPQSTIPDTFWDEF